MHKVIEEDKMQCRLSSTKEKTENLLECIKGMAKRLLGNVVNIQSVHRKKSGGKTQYVSSSQGGRKEQSVCNENVLTRQLPEAARTERHQKDVTRKNGVSIRKDRRSAVQQT